MLDAILMAMEPWAIAHRGYVLHLYRKRSLGSANADFKLTLI